jgi:hypothetical protein
MPEASRYGAVEGWTALGTVEPRAEANVAIEPIRNSDNPLAICQDDSHFYDDDPAVDYDAEEPPVPQWALNAAAEHDRADLASAAKSDFTPICGPALAGMRALELCDPVRLAEAGHARAVLDGIVVAQRMIARMQAIQQCWIAAFARPGVAVPLADVVESTGNSLAEKLGAHVPMTDDEIDVPAALSHPFWHPAIIDAASRFAAAELACATHLAPITARVRLERAGMMVDTLPATLAAQRAGHLDGYRAAIIADGVMALPSELRPQVERDVLAAASSCTASELRRRVAQAVIKADPEGAEDRAAAAATTRHTSVTAVENDMALFRAVLSAPDALTVHGVLDSVATSLKAAGLADGRGSAQLRADVFADLFRTLATTGHAHLARPGATSDTARPGATSDTARPATGIASCHGDETHPMGHLTPHVSLSVQIDFATLAGITDHPGEIAGYGAVTASTARALAASAATVRALIEHPAPPPEIADPGYDAGSPPVRPELDERDGLDDHDGLDERTGPGERSGTGERIGLERDGLGERTGPGERKDLVGRHSGSASRSRTCGTVVDPGRAVYRPPEATEDYVRNRDGHCQFPGCRTRAERCDIDHRVPFQGGGATCPCNLDTLCRTHHRLKTFTSWHAEPDESGRLVWISPLGNTYALAPELNDSDLHGPGHILQPRRSVPRTFEARSFGPSNPAARISQTPRSATRDPETPSPAARDTETPSPAARGRQTPSSLASRGSAAALATPVRLEPALGASLDDADNPPPF